MAIDILAKIQFLKRIIAFLAKLKYLNINKVNNPWRKDGIPAHFTF